MDYATHFQHATHIGCTANQQLASDASLTSLYTQRHTLEKLDKGYKQAFSRELRKKHK